MSFLNVEIKAKCNDPAFIRNYLLSNGALFKGLDIQTDTYFKTNNGRLKLREGTIENNLIYYERENQATAKNSHFNLIIYFRYKAIFKSLSSPVQNLIRCPQWSV